MPKIKKVGLDPIIEREREQRDALLEEFRNKRVKGDKGINLEINIKSLREMRNVLGALWHKPYKKIEFLERRRMCRE